MTFLAATATGPSATDNTALGWLIAAAAIWLGGYAIACWIWPFRSCRLCHGTGRRRSPTGRAFRHCRRCDNTGDRLRAGRVLWIYLRNEYDRRPRNHR